MNILHYLSRLDFFLDFFVDFPLVFFTKVDRPLFWAAGGAAGLNDPPVAGLAGSPCRRRTRMVIVAFPIPPPFVAPMVTVVLPAALGVPLIRPLVAFSDNPLGRAPVIE